MQEYGIAGGTIDKAMGLLHADDLIKTVRGKGLFVTAPEERMSGARSLPDTAASGVPIGKGAPSL
jgi:DNA-binding GntR family transcriptional regulator